MDKSAVSRMSVHTAYKYEGRKLPTVHERTFAT